LGTSDGDRDGDDVNDERKPGSRVDIDADDAIDTVVRRMTAVDDETSASEARVLARIRTRPDPAPALSAVPRLAWAALVLIALAAGSLWLASRPARVQPSAVVTRSSPATAPRAAAPLAPSTPSSATAPTVAATAAATGVSASRGAGPDRARLRLGSRAPTVARQADPGEGAANDAPGLPAVPPITVASIEPAPLAAPAPVATDAVTDGSAIAIDQIAIEPIDASIAGANSHARGPQ
jgi:hypothetical protein